MAEPGYALDDEISRLFGSVERARNNRWYEGDLTDPRFDGVLAAVTNRSPLEYAEGLDLASGPRRNSWREDPPASPEASTQT